MKAKPPAGKGLESETDGGKLTATIHEAPVWTTVRILSSLLGRVATEAGRRGISKAKLVEELLEKGLEQ